MNNITTTIKKIFPALPFATAEPSPSRDWMLILLFSFGVTILFFILGAYLYVGARSGFLYAPPQQEEAAPTHISQDAIADLVTQFERRKVNYEAGNIRRPNVTDPR